MPRYDSPQFTPSNGALPNGSTQIGSNLPFVPGMSQPMPPPVSFITPDETADWSGQQEIPPGANLHEFAVENNLALHLDDGELHRIGDECGADLEDDLSDREPLFKRFKTGFEMMGLISSSLDDGPFPGSSNIVMPLMLGAVNVHWARAMNEIWPPGGPARSKIEGKPTQQMTEAADRLSEYLNYQLIFEDEGCRDEHAKLLWYVPFLGSGFIKTYHDPYWDRIMGVYVDVNDLIAPARTSSLKTAPRFSHRIYKTPNEVKELQRRGIWRDIDLGDPATRTPSDYENLRGQIDGTGSPTQELTFEIIDQYVFLHLKGFEDRDQNGDETGVMLPYIVTFEKESRQVLSIVGNWKKSDPMRHRRLLFSHYRFIPGGGFYGLGLIHMLGGMQAGATGIMRLMLDGGAMASMQGGFIAKDLALRGDRFEIEPNVWKPIQATRESLDKGFWSPPFKAPDSSLFNLLGTLIEGTEKLASTQDLQTGDTNVANAPAASVLAVLENGSKAYSALHQGYHASMHDELRLRLELTRERIAEGGEGAAYPYDVEGQQRQVLVSDFAQGVSIQPVSDPNIFSSTQRIALWQMVYQYAKENPGIIDIAKVLTTIFEALRIPDYEEYIVAGKPINRYDPVTENGRIMRQLPVKAYPEDDHMAHMMVHKSFIESPQFGGNPQVQQVIGPAMQAHLAEHIWGLLVSYYKQAGVQVPPIDPQTGEYASPPGVDLNDIARAAARIAPQLVNAPGLPPLNLPKAPDPLLEQKVQNAQQLAAIQSQKLADQHQQTMQHTANMNALQQQEAQQRLQTKAMEANLTLAGTAARAEAERQHAYQEHITDMAISSNRAAREAEMTAAKAAQDHVHAAIQTAADITHQAAQAQAERQQTAIDAEHQRHIDKAEAHANMELQRKETAAQVEAIKLKARAAPKSAKPKDKK